MCKNATLSIVVPLFAFYINGCKSTDNSAELLELQIQNKRHPLCGIERYAEREDRNCGIVYINTQSPHCGVEEYNTGPSKSCPGYLAFQVRHVDRNAACPAGFRDGGIHYTERHRTHSPGGGKEGHVFEGRPIRDYYRRCVIDEYIPTCALPEFGVYNYHFCRHPAHGIERFEVCRRPEHGVESYKQCQFYKSPEEAMEFGRRIESDLPMMRDNLIIHQGNYYAIANQEAAMVSLIARYDGDELYKAAVNDLKLKFGATFGKRYESLAVKPDGKDDAQAILTHECKEGDTSRICQSVWGYQISLQWFQENIKDIETLVADLTKFKQDAIAKSLFTIGEKLKSNLPEAQDAD